MIKRVFMTLGVVFVVLGVVKFVFGVDIDPVIHQYLPVSVLGANYDPVVKKALIVDASGAAVAVMTGTKFTGPGTYVYSCPSLATYAMVGGRASNGAGGGTASAVTAGGGGGAGGSQDCVFTCSGGAITIVIGPTPVGHANADGDVGADVTITQGSQSCTSKGGCAGLGSGAACGVTTNAATNQHAVLGPVAPLAGLAAAACVAGGGRGMYGGGLFGAGGACSGSTGSGGGVAWATVTTW